MTARTSHPPRPTCALLIADRGGSRPIRTEYGPCDAQAIALTRSEQAARGPLPLSALTLQHTHPIVIGLLRPELHVVRNRALAQTMLEAEERAIRAIADQHQWRMITVLGLQPETNDTDPIEHLLDHVRDRHADVVVAPNRQHLTDLRGHDRLETVRRQCGVATTSPQYLWPCTAPTKPLP
ncbi:hypothetical protein AB0H42_33025 [Nocardia sp. NPDC050799]|uniref:hypothetical protein n=1 Tax=Nocardia sp. NPDC050799 TaxID=3154842 RepID=UPI00340492C0